VLFYSRKATPHQLNRSKNLRHHAPTHKSPSIGRTDLSTYLATTGRRFWPYLQTVLKSIEQNWYRLVPEDARAPIMTKGKVSTKFVILKGGGIARMKLDETSGYAALDRGAWDGITASSPFPPLPAEFSGEYVALRINFYYNPGPGDIPTSRPTSYTQEQSALRAKCAAYINAKVEDLESKRVPLPPHECAEVLAWMRNGRVESLYTSGKLPQ